MIRGMIRSVLAVVTLVVATPVGSAAAAPTDETARSFTTGLAIPWAVGGERIGPDGRREMAQARWPDFPVEAIRLWDTRTAWLNLEPRDGRWFWTTLDAHVAKAESEGVQDITLVLAGTPRWAASRVSEQDAPWLGPGSASAPTDPQQWSDYVRAVVTRYAGRIHAYEIGNEPNLPTFWNGSRRQYADLVSRAVREITQIDPDATIVVNAGLIRRDSDIPRVASWLTPIAQVPGIDVISVHLYPRRSAIEDLGFLVDETMRMIQRTAPAHAEVWVTELNVHNGQRLAPVAQREVVRQIPGILESQGISRAYWYAWTDIGSPTLLQFGPTSPAGRELASLSQGRRGR